MTAVAAHLAAWSTRWPRRSALATHSSSALGTPILEAQFADLRLVVEIAWGGGLYADPGRWTDITGDLQAPVSITVGKADEAGQTQPATCSLLLKNPSGRYSKGPQSPNWPYVRRNTPIRVRVILNGISYTRFYGYADGFTPTSDDVDANPQAVVSASGTLRRLNQNSPPLRSVFYRAYALGFSAALRPVAYWPCEDGTNATQIASGLTGGTAMALSGSTSAAFARDTSFPCSAALPQLNGSTWSGSIPIHTGAGANVMRFLLSVPSTGAVDASVVARLYGTGTIARLDVKYGALSNGQLALVGYDAWGNTLFSSAYLSPGITTYSGGFNGLPVFVSAELQTSGSNVSYALNFEPLVAVAGSYGVYFSLYSGTLASSTLGNGAQIVVNPDGALKDSAVGHVIYQSAYDVLANTSYQLNGWPVESASDRLARICSEQGETINVTSLSDVALGQQGIQDFVSLLRAAELADGGVLYDGVSPGLTYTPRRARENQAAALTLDAAAGDLSLPVVPVDDDRLTVNSFTATRTNGSSYTYTDTTSSMSVNAIGTYPGSETVNLSTDAALADYASWRVHLGTVDQYRYPNLSLRFHQAPRILQAYLSMQITNRVDVLNLDQVRSGTDPRPICLIAEGWTETIDKFEWPATLNTSSYDPWRVAHLTTGTTDTSEYQLRLESDGSATVGRADTGAVTLLVATPSGPLWTTAAGDFPMDLNIGGIHVVATAISGATSPQTFTVNPTSMPIPDSAAVTFWNAPVLGR